MCIKCACVSVWVPYSLGTIVLDGRGHEDARISLLLLATGLIHGHNDVGPHGRQRAFHLQAAADPLRLRSLLPERERERERERREKSGKEKREERESEREGGGREGGRERNVCAYVAVA